MERPVILNSEGKPIILNAFEKRIADINQKKVNDLGFEIDITTLTTIQKRVTEQKFFQIAFADYVPVKVGEGAFSSNLIKYREFNLADDFSTGVINTGANNTRLAQADAGVDSVPVKILNWAKGMGYSLFDIQMAAKAGNWDLISAKSRSLKKNWDLGLQKIAFLGLAGDPSCLGLYTQTNILTDTVTIPEPLGGLSAADIKDFVRKVLNVYRGNSNRSAWPTHFVIPEFDFLGLTSMTSPEFPIKTVLELLEDAFKLGTQNKSFKILPSAYGDKTYNALGVNIYALYNFDEDSIQMNLPVDFTNTIANTIEGINWQSSAYGQFSGVQAYRNQEIVYFTNTANP